MVADVCKLLVLIYAAFDVTEKITSLLLAESREIYH